MSVLPSAATQLTAENAESKASVEQAVVDEIAAEGKADFWVVFDEQADLTAAYGIEDWAARGQYVYDRLTEAAADSQAAFVEGLRARDISYDAFWITNAIQVRSGDQTTLDWARSQAEAARIAADWEAEVPEPTPPEEQAHVEALEWNIERVRADEVWDNFGVRGEGVVVGTIDTGVDVEHPALMGQYRGNRGDGTFDHNYNWWAPDDHLCIDPEAPRDAPCDSFFHGTHTMGTIVGEDANGENEIGVAPGARWITAMGCRITDCPGEDLLSSFEFMLAPTDLDGENPRPDLRPHVLNNSWANDDGSNEFFRPIVDAVEAAGIFPVFGNGNNGPECGTVASPASYSYGVGAFDINNAIADFSARGPSPIGGGVKPDISAPGVDVRSAIPVYLADGIGLPEPYGPVSGTSMAAPHVAGAAALLIAASPELVGDIDRLSELLNEGAIATDDLTCGGEPDHNNVWGHGRLDAYASVELAPRGPAGTLVGTVTDALTGEPIGGAAVTIEGSPRQTVTTPDGIYDFGLPVPAGTWQVTVSAVGYRPATGSVDIAHNTTSTLDLVPSPLPIVSGTITDANDGSPVAGATVTATNGDNTRTATIGDDGGYRLFLDIGTWTVAVEAGNYVTETRKVDASEDGQHTTLDVALRTSVAATDIEEIDTVMPVGSQATFDVQLSNAGSADLTWEAFETGGLRGDLQPGDVRTSWQVGEGSHVIGVGYHDGNLWTAERRGESDRGPWTNAEYGVDGRPTGREYVASWLPGSDNSLSLFFPGHMVFDTTHGRMCQLGHAADEAGAMYCWDPDSGEVVDAMTGPWSDPGFGGIAYSPDDDTFYIGDLAQSGGGSVIYQVAGFSHASPGETLGRCTLPAPDIVRGALVGGDLAYNSSFGVLWVAGRIRHDTRGRDDVFWQVDPRDCSLIDAFEFDHPAAPEHAVDPGLAIDQHGNLWTSDFGFDVGVGPLPSAVYLVESGLGEFVDVPWLDVSAPGGTVDPADTDDLAFTIDTSGLEPGVYSGQVVFRTNAARQRDVFVPIRVLVAEYVQGINVGGPASTGQRDSSEDAWAADQAFDGSWGYEGRSRGVTRQRPIEGTDDDGLYQQQRTGRDFAYRFEDLPDGTYDLELHFAEIFDRQPGSRRFDVTANGTPLLVSYDIAESVGAETATVRTFRVEVTGGSLRLGLERRPGFGQPAVAAIRLAHRPDLTGQ